jgi:hypothetical protein
MHAERINEEMSCKQENQWNTRGFAKQNEFLKK